MYNNKWIQGIQSGVVVERGSAKSYRHREGEKEVTRLNRCDRSVAIYKEAKKAAKKKVAKEKTVAYKELYKDFWGNF